MKSRSKLVPLSLDSHRSIEGGKIVIKADIRIKTTKDVEPIPGLVLEAGSTLQILIDEEWD